MSSLCIRSPWGTTASKERAKGLGTRWNTNTQTYLKLFDYQSASPALEDKNEKTCEIMQPFKKKKKKRQNRHWATSWHLLDKTEWRGEKLKESGFVSSRLEQREEASHPSLSLPFAFLLQGQSLIVTDCHVIWAHLDFSYSILTPFTTSISLPRCSCFNWPSI